MCENRGIAPPFLTSTLDGEEWYASRPGRFTLGENYPVTHWLGGWVGLIAGLDDVGKRKTLAHSGNRSPAFHPTASRSL
jgi:hypothetical protein